MGFILDFSKSLHIFLSVVISQWRLPVGVHWTANRSLNNCIMTLILSVNVLIYVVHRTEPDAEISGPDLSDRCSNSDEDQVIASVRGNDVGGCGSRNDTDDDNEYWALWDENNNDFYMISFLASSHYKPPRSRQKPVSTHEFLCHFLVTLCLQK